MKLKQVSTTADQILEHVKILASDEFEGRSPGSPGESKTIEYLSGQCQEMGLIPAGDKGSYYQSMSVQGVTSRPQISFTKNTEIFSPEYPSQFVAHSKHLKSEVSGSNSEVVFVGYGIDAPEYNWNDYADVDVKGKTVVVLIGQPQRTCPDNPGELDQSFFKGNALTYYGRWTYKYEKASEMGAAAVLIVHETDPAGYGYDVVKSSWTGENFQLQCPENRVALEGWLSLECSQKLFKMANRSFDNLKAAANNIGFKAFELGITLDFNIENSVRSFESNNVIAKLEGNDDQLKSEAIIYSAHWDHFGIKKRDGQVDVYSGAIDNGVAVSMTLEIARQLTRVKESLDRSVLFFFTTLEESGLLGAEHYIKNPSIALEDTVTIINMDVMNVWGRTRDIVSVALGHSELDDLLEKFATEQNRIVVPDPEPEKGYFFRSDHLPFIQKGIPALFFLFPGSDYIDKPADFGIKMRQNYLKNDYHKPTDKVKDDWNLDGTIDDVELLYSVGYALCTSNLRPEWFETSEFASARS